MNNKEQFKKHVWVALILFFAAALSIALYFIVDRNVTIGIALDEVFVVLRPFIIGAVIAYVLKSTCNGYEKLLLNAFNKKKNADTKKNEGRANLVAVILTYITWAIVVGGLLFIAVPQIVDSITVFIQDLMNNMPMYLETANTWVTNFKEQYPDAAPYIDQAENTVLGWLNTDLIPKLPEIGSTIVLGALEVFNVLKDFVIGIIISVFMLSGRKVFARKITLLVRTIFKESHANNIITEAKYADKMFGGFLEGKIIDSTIVGTIYFIALVIMDIRYAALLALICGVTNIIPFFGPFIGAVPSGLIILMSNDNPLPKLLYFIIFVCVAQFIDGYFIDPHIVGGNIKMSPFSVIFAVLLFGGLWGFGGLLVGVPTFAVIYDIVRKIVFTHLKKTGKKDILKQYLVDSGKIKKHPAPAAEAPVKAEAPAEEPKNTTKE